MKRAGQTKLTARVAAFVLLILPGVAPAPAGQQIPDIPDTAEVLARVRKALGHERMARYEHGYVLEGRAVSSGVRSHARLMFAPDGRFAVAIDGPLGQAAVFDGRKGWARDMSGISRPLQFEDLEEQQMLVWVSTGRWLAGDGSFVLEVDPSNTDEKRVALRVTLGKGVRGLLQVNRADWRPAFMTYGSSSGEYRLEFDDYRRQNGFWFPFELRHVHNGMTDHYEFEALRPAGAKEAQEFARPPQALSRARFDANVSPRLETMRARTGHILVRPLIEGRDFGWFLLDTGAGAMVIDPKVADELQMPAMGEVTVMGVGGAVVSRFRVGKEFALGPLSFSDVTYVECDLGPPSAIMRVPLAGIVGYDVFARAVVEFDMATPEVRIHDPAGYELQDARWQELYFSRKHPVIESEFEGNRRGYFVLDTGSNARLGFYPAGVERFDLLNGRTTRTGRAGGFSGQTITFRAGRVEWFRLGENVIDNPGASFHTERQGFTADEHMTGIIGGGLLSTCLVVFDYPQARIAFVPRKGLLAPRG